MILQALYDYYHRLAKEPKSGIAPEGFEVKEIPFLVVIDSQGNFLDLEDTREGIGKQQRAKKFLVPKGVKRSGQNAWQSANLLWDNPKYLLGFPDAEKGSVKAEEDAKKCHESFRTLIFKTFPDVSADHEINAVVSFLKQGDFLSVFNHSKWVEVLKSNGNLTFKVSGQYRPVAESETVSHIVTQQLDAVASETPGICLVTGNEDTIERTHPVIKGVLGGQTSGGNIISFNWEAAESYGKKQGANSPVGKKAAFAYTTALNHLLSKDSRQKLNIADTTIVFWAEQSHPMEDLLQDLFGQLPQGNPNRNTEAVKALYQSPWRGQSNVDSENIQFYILGLAPNAARIAIRFWEITTVQALASNICQHFEDVAICHGPQFPEHLPLNSLLRSMAVQGKSENIPPNIAGETIKSILNGGLYPQSLLQVAIQRTRLEHDVPYWRAALIKGCVNRYTRKVQTNEKELTMSLDETNINIGYCLGRLFATLEKIQEESHPGINATIRDRYYGSASSTPIVAFVPLMKLNKHHLTKLENRGRAVNFERTMSRIMEFIPDFPKLLTLQDQGRFAIGYYHQRQAFFTKSPDNIEPASTEAAIV